MGFVPKLACLLVLLKLSSIFDRVVFTSRGLIKPNINYPNLNNYRFRQGLAWFKLTQLVYLVFHKQDIYWTENKKLSGDPVFRIISEVKKANMVK